MEIRYLFIAHYIKDPKQTGALCSSSKKLALAMLKNVDFKKSESIVEIGPGMGVFTKEILKFKRDDTNFFVIEINQNMADKLKKEIPNIEIEIQNALNLQELLKKRDIKELDNIISGIPWAMLSIKEQLSLLKVIYDSLKTGGTFNTFAYLLPNSRAYIFKKILYKFFTEVKISKIIWQNIPPAFVYYCKK